MFERTASLIYFKWRRGELSRLIPSFVVRWATKKDFQRALSTYYGVETPKREWNLRRCDVRDAEKLVDVCASEWKPPRALTPDEELEIEKEFQAYNHRRSLRLAAQVKECA